MKKLPILTLLLSSLALACSSDQDKPTDPVVDAPGDTPAGMPDATPDPTPPAAMAAVTEPTEFHAQCGHTIDGIGQCGNYIEVDGEFVEIVWPELGSMEWCDKGDEGATVMVAGALADGKFVATSYEPVE